MKPVRTTSQPFNRTPKTRVRSSYVRRAQQHLRRRMMAREPPGYWDPALETMKTGASKTVLSLASVGEGETLLDVGCGSAPFLSRLGVGTLVGIDVSHEALSIARGRTQAHLILASGEWLPFRQETFDRVLCHHALEHFDDMPKGLGEMHRVLRPRCSLVLAYPNSSYFPFLVGFMRQDPLHRGRLSSRAKFAGFRRIKKYVFLNIPHLGDSVAVSKIPLLSDLFYNVVVLMEKTGENFIPGPCD